MALNTTMTDAKGVSTTYHRIGKISLTPFAESKADGEEHMPQNRKVFLDCEILSYTSQDIRQNGIALFATKGRFNIETSWDVINSAPMFAVAYALLKQNERFADAEDV